MKKYFFVLFSAVTLTAAAQGKFNVKNFEGYTVHVYQPAETSQDGGLIIESRSGLVLVDQAQTEQYKDYLNQFTKPVMQTVGETDAPLGSTQSWNGVNISFNMSMFGSRSGADIMVGKDLFYSHFLPAQVHATMAQVKSAEDIDTQLNNANILASTGCSCFVDGHGNMSGTELPKFLQKYYSTMKKAYKKSTSAADFVAAMEKAFPKTEGTSDLALVAQQLYK